jgi:predicted molibdopterin-dependent oxidoreductase YjgC
MPETVKLTIDGREIQAEKGKLLIEVARQNGIEVPAFCYHEDSQAASRLHDAGRRGHGGAHRF